MRRGEHDVDTLGSQNLQATLGVSEGLRLFGPHAGCVDDVLCAYVQALAGLQVCQLCADDAADASLVKPTTWVRDAASAP